MARIGCERERELLEVIGAGRWAQRCDEDLHAHVAGCPGCSELAEVATALFEDRRATRQAATIPESGVVWWRIQLRARRERERAAGRAVSMVHAVALLSALAVAAVVVGATLLAQPSGALMQLLSSARAGGVGIGSFSRLAAWSGPLLLALAAWLALAPVAVWLAVTEE